MGQQTKTDRTCGTAVSGAAVLESLMRAMELQRAEDVKQILVMPGKDAGGIRNG